MLLLKSDSNFKWKFQLFKSGNYGNWFFKIILHQTIFFLFLNNKSLQDIGNSSSPVFFCKQCIVILLGKYCRVVSKCFLQCFEFNVIIHLNCLPTKARKLSLHCYLTHSWWKKRSRILSFMKRIREEKWRQSQTERELSNSIFCTDNHSSTWRFWSVKLQNM